MYGKMSTGMVTMAAPPRMAMSIATTTKVYGRRSANRTIHIGVYTLPGAGAEAWLWLMIP